jgi:hypothetical protein
MTCDNLCVGVTSQGRPQPMSHEFFFRIDTLNYIDLVSKVAVRTSDCMKKREFHFVSPSNDANWKISSLHCIFNQDLLSRTCFLTSFHVRWDLRAVLQKLLHCLIHSDEASFCK